MRRTSTAIAILAILLACAAFAQEGQTKILPRWKWHKGDTFRYRLSGDVVSQGGTAERSLVSSVITINAKDDRLASFSNIYTEIRWLEKELWYNATEEGLKEHSAAFVMDTAGKVTGEDKESAAKQQEFLDVLMPLPPKPVEAGGFWPVDLQDADLHGICELSGYGRRGGRSCAIFKMELASREREGKTSVRELKATFYFDLEEGCFVHVERRMETRGDKPRDERLTVELVSSPKHQSAAEKEQVIIESLRRRLERRPDDASILRQLSDQYARLGKLDDAIGMLDRILKNKAEDVEILSRKGNLLLATGNAREALAHFKRVIGSDKGFSPALLGAARASMELQKYDDCARYARLSLGVDGKQPYQAHYVLGAALAKMGKTKEARAVLERYIELNPDIDKERKPIIAFTKDNDVSLVVRRTAPGVDVTKRLKYTPEELAEGRELIKALKMEESVRLRLTPEEVVMLLEHIAQAYGKKPPEMIADFLADRDKTYEKVKTALEAEGRLPRDRLAGLAASDELEPVTMEALLSMMEPGEAFKKLETLVIKKPEIARYHYLLGRYYISNPGKFGRKALKRFELAVTFDRGNALYHFALAYACLKLHNQSGMLDELTTRKVDLARLESARVPVAKERLKILTELEFAPRIRRVTAWTLDDRFEARIVKELLESIIEIANGFRKDDIYYWGVRTAQLAYYMTLQLEEKASSALMLVTASSAREAALGALVEVHADAASDPKEPKRKEYEKELTSWRGKLAEVEDKNMAFLRAYVEFLKRSEQAFQVWPYTEPSKADEFIDRLLAGEVPMLLEEVERQRKLQHETRAKTPGDAGDKKQGK